METREIVSTQATADADLAGNVRAKIAGNMRSCGENVVVEVKNGVVTLSGSVPSQAAHDEAVGLASTTDRVRRVDDEIHVIAPLPPRRERRGINPSAYARPRAI